MTPPPIISSPQNPLIRRILKLRDNRYRQREGAVLVDGTREISRALAAGFRLQSLLTPATREKKSPLDDEHGKTSLHNLVDNGDKSVVLVSDELLAKVAYGGNPRGAVAVFDRPEPMTLERVRLPENPLVLVLVGIEKPGNAGAIFRSADAVGADAVILCGSGCDLFNPNLIRGSLGTVFSLPAVQALESDAFAWIRGRGLHCVTTIVGASQSFWDADYRGPTAIVVGSEAEGLAGCWRPESGAQCPAKTASDSDSLTMVSIPMAGIADSLNVSVAAAVLLFEARRQRLSLEATPSPLPAL
ncbi:MAG: RNA methyltransferase [Planctomycetaceae bacterium]|nr:MAG: RNA methyltransferase [Planctomycetaceae bacterium]